MKLSMWMLLDELAELSPRSYIRSGSMTIEGFRHFSDDGSISPGCLYIGPAPAFFGAAARQTVLAHRQDMLLIDGADTGDVFNRVIAVFEKYNGWDERLRLAMFEPQPYQAVLDVAHDMFRCAMLFGCRNFQIYAITRQYPKDEVYEEWDEVKALMTMPLNLLERWKNLNVPIYPDNVDPAFSPVWPGMKFEWQIRTNCYLGGKVWGHLYLYYKEKTVSPAVPQLTRYVADLLALILQRTQTKYTEKYAVFSWLVEILDGKDVPQGVVQSLYWLLRWNESDELCLYQVAPQDAENDERLFYWLCDSVSDQCAGAAVFPFNNTLVIIVRASDNSSKLIPEIISRLISVNNYHCGISFAFKGLRNIASFYAQAGYAIRFAPDSGGKIHRFSACPLAGAAEEIKSYMKWRDWVPPSLYRLIDADAAQGTAYYDTLYYLLVNKWHLGNTAKALFIHRNTLLYRLDRIEAMMDLNIHDDAICAFLRLCYSWLREDYPVLVPPHHKDPRSGA